MLKQHCLELLGSPKSMLESSLAWIMASQSQPKYATATNSAANPALAALATSNSEER